MKYFLICSTTVTFLISIISEYNSVVNGHPTWVPNSKKVCKSMTPHHHREAQTSPSPFSVTVSADKVKENGAVTVYLTAKESSSPRYMDMCETDGLCDHHHHHHNSSGFKGYYIQAREVRRNRPIGSFVPTEDKLVKVHDCGRGKNNAAFHGIKGHKTNVTLEWIAPNDFEGKVIFVTTFVKKYHKFWIHVNSTPVSVRKNQIYEIVQLIE